MATAPVTTRPPLPPFTRESAIQKVRLAEDGWNSRDPAKVALAYAVDSRWRNRAEFINGRDQIIAFLTRKWVRELDYRLIKELWAFTGNRTPCASRTNGTTTQGTGIAPGNENWEFNGDGLRHDTRALRPSSAKGSILLALSRPPMTTRASDQVSSQAT